MTSLDAGLVGMVTSRAVDDIRDFEFSEIVQGSVHKRRHVFFGYFWPFPPLVTVRYNKGDPPSKLRHKLLQPIFVINKIVIISAFCLSRYKFIAKTKWILKYSNFLSAWNKQLSSQKSPVVNYSKTRQNYSIWSNTAVYCSNTILNGSITIVLL